MRLSLLALAATTACASSPSPGGGDIATPSDRPIAVDDQQVYRTTVAPNAKAPLTGPPDRAFDALKAVYAELEIPVGMLDPIALRIGNTNFWVSRRLAGQAMSTYINCGETFSGPVANNYRIYISLLSVVRGDGKGGSELETAFRTEAQNMEGTSSDRIPCGSTGRLEERIRKAVLLKLTSGT